MPEPSVLDNTPWWVPGVSLRAGSGIAVARCTAYEDGNGRGPRHLEGGFYDLRSLGPHVWVCKARSDGRFRMECVHGHKGQVQDLCQGHVQMIRKRGSGVCPPCAHPPEELALQERMTTIRARPELYRGPSMVEIAKAQQRAVSELWDIQAELNELVERGIVHRCQLTLTEVS